MTVLLSIKPEFANKIFDGSKKYEYRRAIFKRSDIRRVVVYASSPVKKVIGEFTIDNILEDKVEAIWNETSLMAGISKKYFMSYFENKDKAYAIKIGHVTRYRTCRNLSDYNIVYAPQSFAYINE